MEFLDDFLTLLWSSLDVLSIVLFVAAYLPRRTGSRWKKAAIGFFGVILIGYSLIEPQMGVAQLVFYGVLFAFLRCLFSGKWYIIAFIQLLMVVFSAMMDLFMSMISCSLLGVSFDEFVWMVALYATVITLGKLLLVYFAWMCYQHRRFRRMHDVQGKWFGLTVLFPAVSLAIIWLSFFNNRGSTENTPGIAAIAIAMAAANIGILYLIHSLERATLREHQAELLSQQIALQTENFKVLQDSFTRQRRASHEFERHIQTLGALLDREELDAAKEYVGKLRGSSAADIRHVRTNHTIFDVILNQKYAQATEKGISMELRVNDLSGFEMPGELLVVLLSNLLDNAIEACAKVESRPRIEVHIHWEYGLYLSVRNTSNPVQIVDGNIQTDKANPMEHGYGLNAIRYALDQIGGEYAMEYKDGWFLFVAEIR